MTTTRVFSCDDLFKFNNINFDKLTETVRSILVFMISVSHAWLKSLLFDLCAPPVQYNLGFYLQYIATWPDYNFAIASPEGRLQGYSTASAAPAAAPQSLTRFPILYDKVLGKAEGKGEKWHGHVTAITVAAEYRRLGLARRLMAILEDVSDRMYVQLV